MMSSSASVTGPRAPFHGGGANAGEGPGSGFAPGFRLRTGRRLRGGRGLTGPGTARGLPAVPHTRPGWRRRAGSRGVARHARALRLRFRCLFPLASAESQSPAPPRLLSARRLVLAGNRLRGGRSPRPRLPPLRNSHRVTSLLLGPRLLQLLLDLPLQLLDLVFADPQFREGRDLRQLVFAHGWSPYSGPSPHGPHIAYVPLAREPPASRDPCTLKNSTRPSGLKHEPANSPG